MVEPRADNTPPPLDRPPDLPDAPPIEGEEQPPVLPPQANEAADREFPCSQCGGKLTFAPGVQSLTCPYCGHEQAIARVEQEIEELDFGEHLIGEELEKAAADEHAQSTALAKCQACAAEYTRSPDVTSDHCPYCDSPQVVEGGSRKVIKPKALLPFAITQRQANERFRKWIASLWFAPSKLKQYARTDTKLAGMYTPYWTYDCGTTTWYTGQRGEHYWVTQHYTTMVNGKSVSRTRRVRKTRWYSASGVVQNAFDDVLVLASDSLPRQKTEKLEPWDLPNLVPYTDEYLSGFRAEAYHVDLKQGFDIARGIMDSPIRETIRRDIGGDEQRIHTVKTKYRDITFKHILLPVWLSAYRYQQKVYRFVINGRTGEVQGDRPWSFWKIFFLVAGILAAIGTIAGVIALVSAGSGG